MLRLKLQYFGHLMQRTDSLEKTLMLGNTEGRRRRDDKGWDGWMASPAWRTWVWASSRSWWWTVRPGVLWSMGSQRVRHNCAAELNWAESLNNIPFCISMCVYIYVFIHSSVYGHLDCFHVLALVNSAALGCMYLFKLDFISFSNTCPGVGLMDYAVIPLLLFWGISKWL